MKKTTASFFCEGAHMYMQECAFPHTGILTEKGNKQGL